MVAIGIDYRIAFVHAGHGAKVSSTITVPYRTDQLAFCPGKTIFLCGFKNGRINLWDTDLPNLDQSRRSRGKGSLTEVEISDDTGLILSRETDPPGRCRLWSIAHGPACPWAEMKSNIKLLQANRVLLDEDHLQICNNNGLQIKEIRDCSSYATSPCGRFLACVMDKEVKMLETENCREIARWPLDTPRKLTFLAHGAIVAWLDSKQCFVCDVQTGDVLLRKHYVRKDQDPEDSRDTICLSPKRQFVVSLRAGIELTVWNVRNQVRCTSMSLMLHDPKRKL
jgi:hypothetical protein